MAKDNRWDYLEDLEKIIRGEVETMMHEFSFDFKGDEENMVKGLDYSMVELEEMKRRFRALEALEKAVSCLKSMRPVPIDWNDEWGQEESPVF